MKPTSHEYLGGLTIVERPHLLMSTRDLVHIQNVGFRRPGVLVWSMAVARILFAPLLPGHVTFAAWHDDAMNCPTWTDAGCRCEVDP